MHVHIQAITKFVKLLWLDSLQQHAHMNNVIFDANKIKNTTLLNLQISFCSLEIKAQYRLVKESAIK